ncbi:MAG TPA: aminoacyl-tRNA hydrolase [Candidatus Paceibacterota bacterium]|jgi:PTH1 family peptidyl-tRNA hydrolase|nr:aminoacyl-tRNA hydrolase [Candidatus Paceibacterota bacterium]HPC12428.1 aminoacyl-tRNA hydrolase [Candidatus Paceibacterota bacterium]HQM18755.1 aminoacyl-tRNA hydrolase [Candidatus Paceibacterota bacterium]HQO70987.1 aminoacyl-tRNA hydrolase [Candidatus Paceibacterota bacterium]HQQ22177.1 aminoacyl-tRNA hydrolase [Candidatus Paceibacterota bacterium]
MIIVGLGNPGSEYSKSRHNTGRIILETIADKFDFSLWKNESKYKLERSKGDINGRKFDFILPNTFMNNSGNAVAVFIKDKKKLRDLVVIYDDIDLPFGSYKISFNKSSGGHKGLESIIKKVKSKEFVRIRVGISSKTSKGRAKKPKGEEAVLKHLLGNFKEDELKELKKISKEIALVLELISKEGKDKAMSVYN